MQQNLSSKNYSDIPANILDTKSIKLNYILTIIIILLTTFVVSGYLYISNKKNGIKTAKVTTNNSGLLSGGNRSDDTIQKTNSFSQIFNNILMGSNSSKSTIKENAPVGNTGAYFVGDTNSDCTIPSVTKILSPIASSHTVKDGKVYISGVILVDGADPATYTEIDNAPFFSRDKNNIYYLGKPIIGADIGSYKMIDEHIGMDKNYVYYNGGKRSEIDKQSFKIIPNTSYYEDMNNIYQSGGLNKVNVDKPTFKALGWSYYEDKSGVYDGMGSKMEGVDVQTFSMVGEYLAKDKNNVYHGRQILKDIDSNTLTFVGGLFSKDRNNVYFDNKIVDGVDKDTFKYVGGMYARDKGNLYLGVRKIQASDLKTFCFVNNSLNMNLAKDSKSIYGSEIIPNSDSNSFIFLSFEYQKDKNNVYYIMKKIEGADPISFEVVDSAYAKDNKAVYFRDKTVEGADPKTFTSSRDLKGYWGQDSKSKYLNGKLYTADSEKNQYQSISIDMPACDRKSDIYGNEKLGIKEANWTSDKLSIKTYVRVNCSDNMENQKFDITGDKMNLSYKIVPSKIQESCSCTRQMTWKIEGIDKKDYTFEIKQQ